MMDGHSPSSFCRIVRDYFQFLELAKSLLEKLQQLDPIFYVGC